MDFTNHPHGLPNQIITIMSYVNTKLCIMELQWGKEKKKKAITECSSEHPRVTHHLTGSDMWDQRLEKRLLCINVCPPAPAGRQGERGAWFPHVGPDGPAEKCFAPRQSAGSLLSILLN